MNLSNVGDLRKIFSVWFLFYLILWKLTPNNKNQNEP